jgi:serine/threonine protein kinase
MAIHRLTGEKVAIKTLRKKQYESVKMEFPPREVKVLKVLTHPYINQIYDTVVLDDRVHLILVRKLFCSEI